MRFALVATGLVLAASGCTPEKVRTTRPPADALNAAEARFRERGIALDDAGRRPDRFRTQPFCYLDPGVEGRQWDRGAARLAPVNAPIEHEGTPDQQQAFADKCRHAWRVTVIARPDPTGAGQGELIVQPEGWRIDSAGCEPVGNPLLGALRCRYEYKGARPPSDPSRWAYGIMSGL